MSIFGSGETPTEKYARLGSAYTQTSLPSFRDIGNKIQSFIKPDGNPISQITDAISTVTGTARQVTNAFSQGATIAIDKVKSYEPDPTKIPPLAVSFLKSVAGGPPYQNILEQFASYTPLWTLSCLTPNEFNNPDSYRNNPTRLSNVILSSAGRYDAQRTNTVNGAPEYFIDNFSMKHNVAPGAKDGNTNNFNFTFDVYEPYSMGMFLQSMKVAAVNAGYPSYLVETPYLLVLEFKGMKDNGAMLASTAKLTRFFTIRINQIEFKVDEGGSKYSVVAMPLHFSGFSDLVNILPNDISITGETVKSILASGSRSLTNALNRIQQDLVKSDQQDLADVYQIVFPKDSSDDIGVIKSANATEVLKATADPTKPAETKISDTKDEVQLDFGSGRIGSDTNTMGFDATSGGNYVFKYDSDVIDEKGQKVQKEKMSIDTNLRLFSFPQKEKISEVINRIILSSKFAEDAIKPGAIDDNGEIEWYRLDCQIQLLGYDAKRNLRAKKYIYRVVPYNVNAGTMKNPSAAPAGHGKLNKIIAKRYDYIYTGTNNDLLKFDITLNALWYQGQMPKPPNKNAAIVNKDTQTGADEQKNLAVVQTGEAVSGVSAVTGGSTVRPDYSIKTSSASGDKTAEQMVADAFNNAFLNGGKDLATVNIDILGDPFFISDSGINSNYFAKPGPNRQVTSDATMSWESSEIYVYLSWRSPVEPNLGTSGKGGLYNFPKGEWVSPFSGIYKVNYVTSKFSGGTFQQTLEMNRLQGQPTDFIDGSEAISKQSQMLYDTTKPEPPKTTVIDAEDDSIKYDEDQGLNF
jgi:hypothetical protein